MQLDGEGLGRSPFTFWCMMGQDGGAKCSTYRLSRNFVPIPICPVPHCHHLVLGVRDSGTRT